MAAHIKCFRYIIYSMYFDYAGCKIDRTCYRLMNTTDIQHQFIIYKDPEIIISREFIDNIMIIAVIILHTPIFRNFKINRHAHSEMMVQILIEIHFRLRINSIILMEWEKADWFSICPIRAASILRISMLVQYKLIICSIVLSVIGITVVIVISLIILQEQAICIWKSIYIVIS